AVKKTPASTSDPIAITTPIAERNAVAQKGSQPSANGVSHVVMVPSESSSGRSAAIRSASAMSPGIRPRIIRRGRRRQYPKPRPRNRMPMKNSLITGRASSGRLAQSVAARGGDETGLLQREGERGAVDAGAVDLLDGERLESACSGCGGEVGCRGTQRVRIVVEGEHGAAAAFQVQ